jgi:hypothetical protein
MTGLKMFAMTAVLAATTVATTLATTLVTAPAAVAADVVTTHGALRDLAPAAAGPLDGAHAVLVMVSDGGHTGVRLNLYGIDPSAADRTFGAHLHVGPCVAGNGAAAGPHYNTDVLAGRVPPRIDETTEIWLDFTVTGGGTGHASAYVPFVPAPGERAIVIHQEPTDDHGVAGPRLACLPVSW